MLKYLPVFIPLGVLFATQAVAAPAPGAPNPNCAKGLDWNDGCLEAPVDGVVKYPNFFSDSTKGYVRPGVARQSGQAAYAKTPPYNVAGVDFPVGYSAAAFAGKDPTVTPPKGCEYYATGSALGGPLVECNHARGLDIEGYDFGLHNCVPLDIKNGNTGPIVIKNNRFVNGSNCTRTEAVATGYTGDAFPGYIRGATLCAGVPTQGSVEPGFDVLGPVAKDTKIIAPGTGACAGGFKAYLINNSQGVGSALFPVKLAQATTTLTVTGMESGRIALGQTIQARSDTISIRAAKVTAAGSGQGATGTYTISSASFTASQTFNLGRTQNYLVTTENGLTSPVTFTQNYVDGDGIDRPIALSAAAALYTAAPVTVKYNAFFRIQARPVSGNTAQALDVEDNYWEGFVYDRSGGHGEIVIDAYSTPTAQPSVIYRNNTVLETANAAPKASAASIFATSGQEGTEIVRAVIQYNTTVVNSNHGVYTVSAAGVETAYATYRHVDIDSNYMDGTGSLFCMWTSGGAKYETPSPNPAFRNNYNMVTGHKQNDFGVCH